MIAAPLFHSWGLANYTLGVPLASTFVLRRRFDPEGTLRAIARHRATALVVVPVMLQRILELPQETLDRYDTSSLRVIAVSGSRAARPARDARDGPVRRRALQPLRLDRGRVGDDRHAGGPARGARLRRQTAARHGREAVRRGRPRGRARADRPHLRRQRLPVRGLHGRRHEGDDRRADVVRRRRPLRRAPGACSSTAATTT